MVLIDVKRFPFRIPVLTDTWMSDVARKDLLYYATKKDNQHAFMHKLESCCKADLLNYKGTVLHEEWDGVFCFGIRSSLFRLVGFFDGPDLADYIVIRTFTKSGQKFGATERAIINFVADVKNKRLWRKVET